MSATRLYLRCLAWGLRTGATVRGGVGLLIGILLAVGSSAAVAVLALAAGIIYGTIVAVVPSVLGGIVVVVVLSRRHPRPASLDAVGKDLAMVFAAVVVALDLVVIVYWLALGGWTAQLLVALMALLIIDAAVAAILHPARRSIARAWVGAQMSPALRRSDPTTGIDRATSASATVTTSSSVGSARRWTARPATRATPLEGASERAPARSRPASVPR